MSDCCQAAVPKNWTLTRCPRCRSTGKLVALDTVKALLTEAALRQIAQVEHRFCAEPSCDVVYFSGEGTRYRTTDVRVPVWQKEPYGRRMICYCFGESESQIRAEIETTGSSAAAERVRADIASGRCACAVRNPRGVCCLGDVAAAIMRVKQALLEGVTAEAR